MAMRNALKPRHGALIRAGALLSKRRTRSAGYAMLELSIALAIAALAAVGTIQANARNEQILAANLEADKIADLRLALQNYVDENLIALQAGSAVVKGAVTVPASGASPTSGTSLKPSITQMVGMGYLNAGFVNSSVIDGVFDHIIEKFPAGCVSTACSVEGKVWRTTPYFAAGSTSEMDGVIVGAILSRVGGLAGASFPGSTATITGGGGGWTWTNPVSGNPVGVVALRFGTTVMTNSFLRINDNRDPNFQGNFTVAGNSNFGGNVRHQANTQMDGTLSVTGATTVNALTVNGATTANGPVTVNNNMSVTGSAGVTGSVTVGGGATISGGATINGGATVNGDATVSGVASAQRLRATDSVAVGSACSSAGQLAQDSSATGSMLVCRGGAFRRVAMGLGEVAVNTGCPSDNAVAQTSAGEGVFCRNGVWRLMSDRLTQTVPVALFSATGSAAVPAPTCGAGGTPDMIVTPLHTGADYAGSPPRNRFEARITGLGPWIVNPVLVDNTGVGYTTSFSGTAYNLAWAATTYCRYS